MNVFFITVQIMAGILLPVFALLAAMVVFQLIKLSREDVARKVIELEKSYLFDDEAEFYEVPNPTMVGVRLKKKDKIVWDGAIERNGMI